MASSSIHQSLKDRIKKLQSDIDEKIFNKENSEKLVKTLQENKFLLNSLFLKIVDAENRDAFLSDEETEKMVEQLSGIDRKINGLASDFARQMFFRTILVLGLGYVLYRYYFKKNPTA